MTAPLGFSPQDSAVARSVLGLADLPTVVALGPFDDLAHAEQLAAAFTAVRRRCNAQFVLLGKGRTAPLSFAERFHKAPGGACTLSLRTVGQT